MAEVIFILCAVFAVVCAGLLWGAYRRYRLRVVLWTFLCFVFLAINNVLLYVDSVVLPELNLEIPRKVAVFLGLMLVVFGLCWDLET